MKKNPGNLPTVRQVIEQYVYLIRNQRVMLDIDLAKLYGVETRAMMQAVKRNLNRFPDDFMFQLSNSEMENWMSQNVISNPNLKMGLRKEPHAFTEQGVSMLSSILRSPQAVAVNIEIMRAFVHLRHALLIHKELGKEMAELKSFLLKSSSKNDREFRRIWQALEKLSSPPTQKEHRIGFNLD